MLMKPINASPCNTCIGTTNELFKYNLPNNETVDGSYICLEKISDGSVSFISEGYNDKYNPPVNEICWRWADLKKGERAWYTFYWKNPSEELGVDYNVLARSTCSELLLAPCKNQNTITIDSKISSSSEQNYFFGLTKFSDRRLYDTENITGYSVISGTIDDYRGYPLVQLSKNLKDLLLEDYRWEEYCIDIYIDNDGNEVFYSRTRILGWLRAEGVTEYILDKNTFNSNDLESKLIKLNDSIKKVIPSTKLIFNRIDNIDNSSIEISSLLFYDYYSNVKYYYIKNAEFKNYYWSISISPFVKDFNFVMGTKLKIWNSKQAEFNISPTYYFRVKASPQVNIGCNNMQDGKINHIKNTFNLSFDNTDDTNIKLNYSYMYLYSLNSENYIWDLVSRSEMLVGNKIAYTFDNFVNGRIYKICAICTDTDGDSWESDDLIFDVDINYIEKDIPISFDKKKSTVDILLSNIISPYGKAELRIYKEKVNANNKETMHYAGGGIAKQNNIIMFDKFSDYNIQNEMEYRYYISIYYEGKEDDNEKTGYDFYVIKKSIIPKFEGSSIMGIINFDAPIISSQFNLIYHTNQDLGELNNELSREYLHSFNKYPKELKGYQNYISGSCSGLLGYEDRGIYYEPNEAKRDWINFVNDDSMKIYRGMDGETLIIGIETSKIKPYYYSNVGLVNEVYMTFKEIDEINKYSIYTTEIAGE